VDGIKHTRIFKVDGNYEGTNERGVVYSMAYGSKGTRFEIIRQNMGVGDSDGICGW
jgi:hypothetical protein